MRRRVAGSEGAKLDEMERSLAADDIGTDLRGVRDLLKKHQVRGAG